MKPKSPPAGRISSATLGLLATLLALPAYAASRSLYPTIDWTLLIAAPTLFSSVAFAAYRSDKHRAERGDSRVPESTLHLLSLLGGWPGALLAQQRYRHKTAKLSFQLIFWLIVLAYQFVALDALLGWRISAAAWNAVATAFA